MDRGHRAVKEGQGIYSRQAEHLISLPERPEAYGWAYASVCVCTCTCVSFQVARGLGMGVKEIKAFVLIMWYVF